MQTQPSGTQTIGSAATEADIDAKVAVILDGLDGPTFSGVGNGELTKRVQEGALWFRQHYKDAPPEGRLKAAQELMGSLTTMGKTLPTEALNRAFTPIYQAGRSLLDLTERGSPGQ